MNAFNATLISAFTSDRLYRVYFGRGEVFFIQIGGQSFGQVMASSFGALGALIYAPFQRQAQAKLAARIRDLDTQPPDLSLAAGKHNFRAMVADFESSALQAPPALRQHGPHLGRWVIQLRGQKPLTLQVGDRRRHAVRVRDAPARHRCAREPGGVGCRQEQVRQACMNTFGLFK